MDIRLPAVFIKNVMYLGDGLGGTRGERTVMAAGGKHQAEYGMQVSGHFNSYSGGRYDTETTWAQKPLARTSVVLWQRPKIQDSRPTACVPVSLQAAG
ncbi:hypothetical protein SKAU_G00164980 [Synaphobranchus kaupii]|uniref:Uncharacterized protein n=1 Tax=Synaphobranchus kaupii TaxID=118154 RepID=A0A9Q1IZT0_SYNKA|nr:hypothetical protein SKAU_G00164980 [Synaphobranchus kaupii]